MEAVRNTSVSDIPPQRTVDAREQSGGIAQLVLDCVRGPRGFEGLAWVTLLSWGRTSACAQPYVEAR